MNNRSITQEFVNCRNLGPQVRSTESEFVFLTRSPGDWYAQKYLRCTALHHGLAFEVISQITLSPGVVKTN